MTKRNFKRWSNSGINQQEFYQSSNLKKERFEKLFPKIQDHFKINLNKHSNVLDVGCNSGLGLSILKKNINCNIFGVDISPTAIDMARKLNPTIRPKINFQCENVITLSYFRQFPDNFFDLAYTSGVLIHIPSKENLDFNKKKSLILEMVRVSKCICLYESYREENKCIETFSPDHKPIKKLYQDTVLEKSGHWYTFDDYRLFYPKLKIISKSLVPDDELAEFFLFGAKK